MPIAPMEEIVHNGHLKLVCVACRTTYKLPEGSRPSNRQQNVCRFLCDEIGDGIYWDAMRKRIRVAPGTTERLEEALALAAKCYANYPPPV